MVIVYLLWPRPYCKSALDDYGIKVPICPDGRVRQVLSIRGDRLRRGGKGRLSLRAHALYTVAKADEVARVVIPKLSATLFWVDASGKETPLKAEHPPQKPREKVWHESWASIWTHVTLPEGLPDGDYKLRAKVETKVGKGQVDLPLALYAPARIHVLTDRPLYKPGNRIKFRALVVRARDLAPLDHRPGRWIVRDSQARVLLEEKAPAGEWGVVAGDFLLDKRAAKGRWTITWESGKDKGATHVQVEPFTLPRYRVTATPRRPFYRAGDKPVVDGAVIYSSGAPVQNAKIELRWSVSGAWPPPTSWTEKLLPKKATTNQAGRFTLQLPEVPKDLQGKVWLSAHLAAIDPAGDRVTGLTSVLLSADAISVSAFTPLADEGLVGGSNNRLYLRVTSADGSPLPNTKIKVRKAWLSTGEGIDATLDEDSVARIQLDPGAPVNVIIPPRPVRRSQRRYRAVRRTRARDLIADQDALLADQVELDRWLALVAPCGKWSSSGDREAKLAISVSAAGAIGTAAARGALSRCVLDKVRRRRLPKGRQRLYALTFRFREPRLPRLEPSITVAIGDTFPSGFSSMVQLAARDARDCLPKGVSGDLPRLLSWRVAKKSKRPTWSWVPDPNAKGTAVPKGIEACVLARLRKLGLDDASDQETLGVVRYTLSAPSGPGRRDKPRPTIMKGYELLVSALGKDGKALGQTKLRMKPGRIPRISMRAEPVLAQAGGKVTVRLLRGPRFRAQLPRQIHVVHFGERTVIKLPKKAKAGTYSYTIPKGKKGWFAFEALGKRALVFVRSEDDLSVEVKPQRPRYAPGDTAKLVLQTRLGKRGAQAAVGLFGVDESLAQLHPLPGADALRSLRHTIAMRGKAFGVLEAQALALGRVRGSFAAEATVLRVSTVPKLKELDVVISAEAQTRFDPNAKLTDRFYTVLAELHRQARAWEKTAPKNQKMTPKLMASLWKKALDACLARHKKVVDAFGRKLRLHRLPGDLLALTDPRQVVLVGTRLPEDVENWSRWVQRRRP
ncbi:MAG: hypothetical protein CSA65_02895 [Proteobacteria bacterium]|nr:MAG: hypothetical protein CSA65_02895 [Pseudomonadota bacterium]